MQFSKHCIRSPNKDLLFRDTKPDIKRLVQDSLTSPIYDHYYHQDFRVYP